MKKKNSGNGGERKKIPAAVPAAVPISQASVSIDSSDKRTYVIAPRVMDVGLCCPHCGECYGHHVTNTYPNGNRRYKCAKCGKPFVAMRKNIISR